MFAIYYFGMLSYCFGGEEWSDLYVLAFLEDVLWLFGVEDS